MSKEAVLNKIKDVGIVAVIRAESVEQAAKITDACVAGGVTTVELCFTVPNADQLISQMVKKYEGTDVTIGAGTVLDPATARIAILNGAQYIVSPHFDPEIIAVCNIYDVPAMAGVGTATEAIAAMRCGASVLKVFPGDVRNNMCYAWMMGAAKLGMHFVAMGPEELAKQMDQKVVQSTFAEARKNGGLIEITDHAEDLKGADVIYGDVWASMGEEAQIPERVGLLSPFRVTMDTLKATENPDVLYLHCLPSFHDFETKMAKEWQAKGVDIREVTDEVFRSRHSVVFDEAENRMHSIKAVMVATIGA